MKIFMAPSSLASPTSRSHASAASRPARTTDRLPYIGSDKPEATEQIATLTNAIPQEPAALVVRAIDGEASLRRSRLAMRASRSSLTTRTPRWRLATFSSTTEL